ncbi:hypothetical protein FAM09_01675 [Niastella caeni]|uniref:Uncharacterized protein n=1 Tax=Niastella caeni TaxID=2569763 RepID=A0A4S8HYU2_9BACT|nr:DUF6520 family protein [Niastella caeni]THU40850.1 hypothetical protein FAM09_01675 [Niastella caeni]
MNKIKLAFIAIAILAAVGGAFATKPCDTCENSQQYIYTGSGYVAVGLYGEDFDCYITAGVCTFWRPDPWQPNVYAPCHEGYYIPQ